MQKINKKGFTLIELLIVIAIIAIIVSVAFVALDPLTRFQDSRDSRRWQDTAAMLNAIKVDQIDNGGSYIDVVSDLTASTTYMITDGVVTSGCDDQNIYCDTNVDSDSSCVDLSDLVDQGYLGNIPVSPNGDGSWSSSFTGYTITRWSTGTVTVRACESENSEEITLSR